MARRIVTGLLGALLWCGAAVSHAEAAKPAASNPRATTTLRGLTAEQQKQLEYERYQKEQAAQQARQQAARPAAPANLTVDGQPDAPARSPATSAAESAATPSPSHLAAGRTRPVRQAPEPPRIDRGTISDAKISSIIPYQLRANGQIAVNVELQLAKPVSLAELNANLRLMIDNLPLEPLTAPVAADADRFAEPVEAMQAAAVDASGSETAPASGTVQPLLRAAQNDSNVVPSRCSVARRRTCHR